MEPKYEYPTTSTDNTGRRTVEQKAREHLIAHSHHRELRGKGKHSMASQQNSNRTQSVLYCVKAKLVFPDLGETGEQQT